MITKRAVCGLAMTMVLMVAQTAKGQDTVRITLPEAIKLAASRDVDILRAENSVRISQTRIETAEGAFQPNLSLNTGPTTRFQLGEQRATVGEQVAPDRVSTALSIGVSSGYTLYNGNIDRASLAQARDLARASDIAANRTSQTSVYTIIASFYQIDTQRELIAVQRENLEAERQQLDQIRAFTAARTRAISDLYTGQASLAKAEVSLLEAQRNLEVAKLGLVQRLRLDPGGRYDFPKPATPAIADESSLTGDSAVVLRPEIAAQQARIDAAKSGMQIAEAGKSPTVSISGSLGSSYSTTDDVNSFGSQLFAQNPNASLGLSLSLPIFDRNRTDAAETAAKIDLDNELLTMSALRQQVSVEVLQARLDLTTSRAQLEAAGRQLEAASQALEVEQARYHNGLSTLVELTQARSGFVAAQGQVLQARNNLELSRQTLAYALGLTAAPRAATAIEK